jgi:alpha-glucoside transport system permease protein
MAKAAKKNKPLIATNNRPFTSPVASAIVTVIALIWTVPTLGLVVTSFRDKEAILSSGWWTSFFNPTYTLDNFREVLFTGGGSLGSQGMIPFAVNSLAITIPAVVLSVGFGLMASLGSHLDLAITSFTVYLRCKVYLCSYRFCRY